MQITDDNFFEPVTETLLRAGIIVYRYERIQCPEYDDLIEKIITASQTAKTPTFVQVSGIPGAGKSTFCKRVYQDSVLVQFDAIMAQIPTYMKDCERLGLVQAFAKWEMPARVIGYEVLRRLIAKKCSFVLEHSGTNAAHLKMMNVLKNQGYTTRLDFLYCDVAEACRRVVEREKHIARHTPLALIQERSAKIMSYLEQYKALADVVNVYDLTDVNNWVLKERYQYGCRA